MAAAHRRSLIVGAENPRTVLARSMTGSARPGLRTPLTRPPVSR